MNFDYYFTPEVPVSLYTGIHLDYGYTWEKNRSSTSEKLTSDSEVETSEQTYEINKGTTNIKAGFRLGAQFAIQRNLSLYAETSINAFLAFAKGTLEQDQSVLSDVYDRTYTLTYDINNTIYGIDFDNFSLGAIYYY